MLTTITEPNVRSYSQQIAEATEGLALVEETARTEYLQFVEDFDDLAKLLLEQVDRVIEKALRDENPVFCRKWKLEARVLATRLQRYPKLVLNISCPPAYQPLKRFYILWEDACDELSSSLRNLTRQEQEQYWSPMTCICFARADLAAVTAHNSARRIYLESLAALVS